MRVFALTLPLLLLTLAPRTSAQPVESGASFTGQVLATDGQQYTILRPEGDTVRVTLWGVALDPSPKFRSLARQRAQRTVEGRRVRVRVIDTSRAGTVRARIEVDGQDLGQRLVREGLAWWDRYDVPGATTLERLERQAQSAGRGLWAQEDLEPPWMPPPAMAAPPGTETPGPSPVDAALEELSKANLAFNAPAEIALGEVRLIELAVSPSASAKELLENLENPSGADTAEARVSNIMTAALTGPAFEIEAVTPETQAISLAEPTKWEWYAEPTRPGRHQLRLSLSALIEVEGTEATRSIETFRRDITVEVPWSQRIAAFFASNWQWFLTVLLIPLVRWGWTRWRAPDEEEVG